MPETTETAPFQEQFDEWLKATWFTHSYFDMYCKEPWYGMLEAGRANPVTTTEFLLQILVDQQHGVSYTGSPGRFHDIRWILYNIHRRALPSKGYTLIPKPPALSVEEQNQWWLTLARLCGIEAAAA